MKPISIDRQRKLVREMLRIMYGPFLSQRLRKMRPKDGRRHGPYVQVAKALGAPVSARDVRYVWTGQVAENRTGRQSLDRIVTAIERQLKALIRTTAP